MVRQASGQFAVILQPRDEPDVGEGTTLQRLAIAKTYSGDLEGTGSGQMLAARTAVEGSAGYVAQERFTGSVHGRRGSFVLQHAGIMSSGMNDLSILVVPDSGTGQLAGLAGKMAITVSDGLHAYRFEYLLPEGD